MPNLLGTSYANYTHYDVTLYLASTACGLTAQGP